VKRVKSFTVVCLDPWTVVFVARSAYVEPWTLSRFRLWCYWFLRFEFVGVSDEQLRIWLLEILYSWSSWDVHIFFLWFFVGFDPIIKLLKLFLRNQKMSYFKIPLCRNFVWNNDTSRRIKFSKANNNEKYSVSVKSFKMQIRIEN